MEQKDEGFILGLGVIGLIVYFIYNQEKKRSINQAKASTQQQVAPIIETLSTAPETPVAEQPVQEPVQDRLRVTEDVMFTYDLIENGTLVGQKLMFVVPKDTIVPMFIVYLDNNLPYTQVETPFGLANIDIKQTENVDGNTPLSRVVAISPDDYYNKPRELWNPPCVKYQVNNLQPTDDYAWHLNYIDCYGDEQEINVPAGTTVLIEAVDRQIMPESVITNFESTIKTI